MLKTKPKQKSNQASFVNFDHIYNNAVYKRKHIRRFKACRRSGS